MPPGQRDLARQHDGHSDQSEGDRDQAEDSSAHRGPVLRRRQRRANVDSRWWRGDDQRRKDALPFPGISDRPWKAFGRFAGCFEAERESDQTEASYWRYPVALEDEHVTAAALPNVESKSGVAGRKAVEVGECAVEDLPAARPREGQASLGESKRARLLCEGHGKADESLILGRSLQRLGLEAGRGHGAAATDFFNADPRLVVPQRVKER
jgi:hypothetical protein